MGMKSKKKKKLLIASAVLLFLGMALTATWLICDWPPPLLILKYGLPPAGGPTGRRMTIDNMQFIELERGYFRMGAETEITLLFGTRRPPAVPSIVRAPTPVGRWPRLSKDSLPNRWVEVHKPFWMGVEEVNWKSYLIRTSYTSSSAVQSTHPVSGVTWSECRQYAAALTSAYGLPLSLPTEAQWEYAARAGTDSTFFWGNDVWCIYQYGNSGTELLVSGGSHSPNPWGLYDTVGNAEEWCLDNWHDGYVGAPPNETAWMEADSVERVVRGGSCASLLAGLACSARSPAGQDERYGGGTRLFTGLRLAINLK